MELPALIAVLVDTILIKCPEYDRVSVTVALESVFAGHPTLLGGNTISMLLGQNNDFTNATVTIGDVHAGHTMNVHLPQPLDPALAALIVRASLPATIHHGDMTINESAVSGVVVRDNYGSIHQTIHQPKLIDPLPAALAALASIPLDSVPEPRADLPHASRLPFESSPHFVGREEELKRLAAAIGTAQLAVVMPAVATGLGGIGKTSLVTEFAYRYGVYFHGGVFWLNCADPDQVASQIAACALDLGIDPTGMTLDEQVQRVLKEWKSPMPRLLIFDNCEDRAVFTQWKPTVGGCRVLVTSRSDQWPMLTQVRLGLLSPVESRALLQRLCARLTDAEADLIATDLGHLPLALHLAGNYLNLYRPPIMAYRNALSIAHESLQGHGSFDSPTAHEQNVEATFMLSFNQLDPTKTIDALAVGMLDGAAWCAPGVSIPRDLVLTFVPDETTQTARVDALRRLQQLGLLDGADSVVLHRLLVQVIQAHLGSREMLIMVENRICVRVGLMKESGGFHPLIPIEPHLQYLLFRSLDCGTIQSARLAQHLGYYEDLRGSYRSAQTWYQYAVMIKELWLGCDHRSTIAALNKLAGSLEKQGMYKDAEQLYDTILDRMRKLYGNKHLDTATSMNNLAFILARQGFYQKAKDLYAQALIVKQEVVGTNHSLVATGMNNLAGVFARQGYIQEAQCFYEQALQIKIQTIGQSHPETLVVESNLAGILEQRGQYDVARRLYAHVHETTLQVLGENHPESAGNLNNLATICMRQKNYAQALLLYEQALAIKTRVFGEDHPSVAMTIDNLANVLIQQGEYGKAQSYSERALAIRENVLGIDHLLTAKTLLGLALVQQHQGHTSVARRYYEQALHIHKRILGCDHPDTRIIQQNLS